jgi:acyl transferase domain-containing protein
MSQRCIQIHGGVGYTREYGAEKLLRDSLVAPIYEGTSQIQSLMAMKDTLALIMKAPQEFVKEMAQARWRSLSARNPWERRLARLQLLSFQVQQHLITRTAADKVKGLQEKPVTSWPQAFLQDWNPKKDFAYAMLHAERLTRILTDVAICELLFEQAQRHPDRQEFFERYLERAEPRCRFLQDEIQTTGQRILDKLARRRERAHNAAS